MKVRGLLLIAPLLLLALPAGAGDKLTMRVSPAVAFAPANLVVRAYVPADPDNRAIEVVAESADFYRSSEMQLDGDKAPRTNIFEFRSLPTGTYQVSAVVIGSHGDAKALVRSEVNVMASGAGDQ
jgi:hypothetical protein